MRGRKKKGVASKSVPQSASVEHESLFEQLRALRKQLADSAGVPPYVVFHDATLREMAAQKPTTLAAFANLTGVGQSKLARYGETFIATIAGAPNTPTGEPANVLS